MDYIPLEKPLVDLEMQIAELRKLSQTQSIDLTGEIKELENRASSLCKKMFAVITAYETVQISRHPRRPTSLDYLKAINVEFIELHGDRAFMDDGAIIGGLAAIENLKFMFIGHQKGHNTKENVKRNFGMARPEGYRKALRLMKTAEKFKLPIVTFIDTPGAYPGVGAEERGQSEAIGKNILLMNQLKVPIISIVIGEGGSGGALAIGVANKIFMLTYSIYSVISPEGCASILLKDASQAHIMAEKLQITSKCAYKLGIIDGIVDEPVGAAHRCSHAVAQNIKKTIVSELSSLCKIKAEELLTQRRNKFLSLGVFHEGT